MLDHDHAVADVAQMLQRGDQLVVIALVQADGGLVQHIHHARQAGADLRRQANALGLAAREGVGTAVKTQIGQAHVVEEQQARGDFTHDLVGNLGLGTAHAQLLEPVKAIGQCGVTDFIDGAGLIALAHAHKAGLAAQACAFAGWAFADGAHLGQIVAHHAGFGFAEAALDVGDDAFEGVALDKGLALAFAALKNIVELHHLVARTPEDDLAHVLGQLVKRGFGAHAVVFGHALQHGEVVVVALVPALDGTAGQTQCREGHDAVWVKVFAVAQAIAGLTGTHGRVEGEQARLQLGQGVVAQGAGELGTEQMLFAVVHLHGQNAATGVVTTSAQGGFKAFGQALLDVFADFDAVNHHVDVVALVLFQLGQRLGVVNLPIHAKAHIALCLQLHKQLGELALLLARQRAENHQLGVFGQLQHAVHHLADGLGLQRQVMVGTKRRAGAGKQQAQVVVDLGDRADGGARVVAGGLLLDGDGWR